MTKLKKDISPDLINKMAQNIDMGLVNYFNPIEQKLIAIPNDSIVIDEVEFEKSWKEDLATIKKWGKNIITISQMESFESFKIMEDFTSHISDQHLKYKLENILEDKKPFRNFNHVINNSDFRQAWFDFKQKASKKYVLELIAIELEN